METLSRAPRLNRLSLAHRSWTSSAPARGAAGIGCRSSQHLSVLLAQVRSRLRAWAGLLVSNRRRDHHLAGCVCRRRAWVALLAPNHLGSRVLCRHKVVCACHLRGWVGLPLASHLGHHRPLAPNHIGRLRHRLPLLSQVHRPQQTSPRRVARPSRSRRVDQEGHRPSRSSGSLPQTLVPIGNSASANRRGACHRGTLLPVRRSPARRLLPEARRRAVSLRETASRRGALVLWRRQPKPPPSPPRPRRRPEPRAPTTPRPQPLPLTPNLSTMPRTLGRRPPAHLRHCRRPQQIGQQTSRRRHHLLRQLRTPLNLPPTRQRWRRRR